MPATCAEDARARLEERFPAGWEEREEGDELELAVYGSAEDEAGLAGLFGAVTHANVEQGWAERWREFHRPVRIGPLWVGPPWEPVPEGVLAVVIDPGRAFGTGAHPTTRLCLSLLLDQQRSSVVDLGCGSGVLSIAAARLGFGPVEGVDRDPVAVSVCTENARANGVSVGARTLDLLTEGAPRATLALANLELGLLEAIAPGVRAERLIASGYLERDRLVLPGWQRLDRRVAGGWAAELFAARDEH